MEATENHQCLMVTCSKCKRVVYAAVNRPEVIDDRERQEIIEMVIGGCDARHVPVEEVRGAEWKCACKKKAKKP